MREKLSKKLNKSTKEHLAEGASSQAKAMRWGGHLRSLFQPTSSFALSTRLLLDGQKRDIQIRGEDHSNLFSSAQEKSMLNSHVTFKKIAYCSY